MSIVDRIDECVSKMPIPEAGGIAERILPGQVECLNTKLVTLLGQCDVL